ncbi:hypothetical protein BaRGS_00003293, partial [Batillaria attramentaria]
MGRWLKTRAKDFEADCVYCLLSHRLFALYMGLCSPRLFRQFVACLALNGDSYQWRRSCVALCVARQLKRVISSSRRAFGIP